MCAYWAPHSLHCSVAYTAPRLQATTKFSKLIVCDAETESEGTVFT